MNIKTAIAAYLAQCENVKKLEPLTLRAYSVDLTQFQNFAGADADVAQLDKTLVSKYIDIISAKYAAKSLKRKVASLKAFFNYLEFEDHIVVTPFRKIKLHIKEPKRVPKALTLFDMEKLLSCLYRSKSLDAIRNRAVLELMFSTGIRISELCNIRLSDVNLETQTVSVKGKGNKERLAFISDTYTVTALKEYLSRRTCPSPYFFVNRAGNMLSAQSVRCFFGILGKKALGKHITPHMIRHTFATLLLEEGVDMIYIKSFLGHSSISTTQIYAASTTYKQRQILTVLHPRHKIRIFIED